MNEVDFKILEALLNDGRITWTELASQFGLSIPAITERVRKLEERGVIQGYSARINYQQLGLALTALIFVTLSHPQYRSHFIDEVQSIAEVLECVHVTGDDDYMLKVMCVHSRHLDEILSDRIKSIPGVMKTRTMIVLSTQKERVNQLPEIIKK